MSKHGKIAGAIGRILKIKEDGKIGEVKAGLDIDANPGNTLPEMPARCRAQERFLLLKLADLINVRTCGKHCDVAGNSLEAACRGKEYIHSRIQRSVRY